MGMKGKSMQPKSRMRRRKQSGFTIVEMLIATVVMVVGLVGVAKLMPMSIRLNAGNRDDSTALVFAQRELDDMVDQPISATTFSDPQGVLCPAGNNCNLGDPTQPRVLIGSPVIMLFNRPNIDFSVAQVAGYSFNYIDPNDPFGLSYDVRWAVITYGNGASATGKRFILGVVRRGGNSPFLPLTLDTMVEK
jgi:prepilin-type N-terminal cleavage/methylation domain-containing protein